MTLTIHVRYRNGAYIARAGNKTASCTASPEAAAREVAGKLGHKHFLLGPCRSQGPDYSLYHLALPPDPARTP